MRHLMGFPVCSSFSPKFLNLAISLSFLPSSQTKPDFKCTESHRSLLLPSSLLSVIRPYSGSAQLSAKRPFLFLSYLSSP